MSSKFGLLLLTLAAVLAAAGGQVNLEHLEDLEALRSDGHSPQVEAAAYSK